jgi:hypothetical protein
MAFYEGIDEEIYEGGDHYMPMQRFRLNQNYTPNSVTPFTPDMIAGGGISTLYPYSGSANYNDRARGGGDFGNLDMNTEKTFMKDVWTEVGPGKYDWVEKAVKGYKDINSGLYRTLDNKNINHGGINFKPAIVGILESLGMGDKINLDKYGGRRPGSIKGTFTDGLSSGIDNIKEGWEEEKDKWGGLLGIDKAKAFFKNKKENQWVDITDIDSQDNQPGGPIINNTSQGDGEGGNTGDPRGQHAGIDYSGANYGPHKDSWSGGSGNQGTTPGAGLHADYNQGGRVYLNLGGLARLL